MPCCARLMQQPRQLRAVFVVGLIQRVEQQNVADVEDVRVHLGPVHVALIKFPVRAQIGEERALLADLVAHDRREGGDAVAHHARGVDVGVLAEALKDEIALRVGAGLAHGVKRKRRIQLGQIHDDIADRAADGAGDAVLNVHQLHPASASRRWGRGCRRACCPQRRCPCSWNCSFASKFQVISFYHIRARFAIPNCAPKKNVMRKHVQIINNAPIAFCMEA